MKLQTLATYSLATATGVALLTGCVTNDSPSRSHSSANSPNSARRGNIRHEKSSSASYEVRGPVSGLSVATTAGDVRVIASDRGGLKVTEKITYTADKPKTSHLSRDGHVTLKDRDCRSGSCSVSYRIEIPEHLTATIVSGGGDITGAALAGRTVARTNGGDVHLSFTQAPADIDAFSGGGDVDLALPAATYAVRAQADGGDRVVGVRTGRNASHEVTARSNGGDVTVARR